MRRAIATRGFPLVALVMFLLSEDALACPFCTALKPAFAERRQRAACVVFGEVGAQGQGSHAFRVHQATNAPLLRGATLSIPADRLAAGVGEALAKARQGDLAVLIANKASGVEAEATNGAEFDPAALEWDCLLVDELAYAYFAKAPATTETISERLKYFARFVEHANPQVAEDAYYEFGQASYTAVRDAAQYVSEEKLRGWLVDPAVRPERKGLIALMLGVRAANGESEKGAAVLERLVLAPSTDFRAGYDGILGAYLVASGAKGLELVEQHLLLNPDAGPADLRHAANALRFYHEQERTIPGERIAEAHARLLERPEVASIAIVDLARWKYWNSLPRVLEFTQPSSTADQETMRSAIGYYLVCPLPEAKAELKRLRGVNAEQVRDVEQNLGVLGDQG